MGRRGGWRDQSGRFFNHSFDTCFIVHIRSKKCDPIIGPDPLGLVGDVRLKI